MSGDTNHRLGDELRAYRQGVQDAQRLQRDEWTVRTLILLIGVLFAGIGGLWYNQSKLHDRLELFFVEIQTTRELVLKGAPSDE